MTEKEAIEWLIPPTNCSNGDENDPIRKHWIAYNMAIKALASRKTGYWIDANNGFFNCSECGAYRSMLPAFKENYCPNCGIKMEVEDA